jgi:transcriptional regulator
MYVPEYFRVDDRGELCAFMASHSFATMVSTVDGDFFSTQLPFIVRRCEGEVILLGHMARANRQWRELGEQEPLVIFSGPHAYVSPSWYESRANVPTWNYMVVQARGRARVLDRSATLDAVRALSAINETDFEKPWHIEELPAERLDSLLNSIVAFEISVRELRGNFKLSQNRTRADRRGVIAGLELRGFKELASEMRRSGARVAEG